MDKLLSKVYAANDVVGEITLPASVAPYGAVDSARGFILFFSNILRFVFVIAGILALLNFVIAGFEYMFAAGDSKKLSNAWSRIWQSLLGLIIITGSFVLAAIAGLLFFGDPLFILRPQVYGPGN